MQAKNLLRNHGMEFEEVNIEQNESAKEFLLAEGHRTMPQIYSDGKLYVEGGFDGLREKLENEIDTTQLGSI